MFKTFCNCYKQIIEENCGLFPLCFPIWIVVKPILFAFHPWALQRIVMLKIMDCKNLLVN